MKLKECGCDMCKATAIFLARIALADHGPIREVDDDVMFGIAILEESGELREIVHRNLRRTQKI